jgi:hypothetical protein
LLGEEIHATLRRGQSEADFTAATERLLDPVA